jgi:hypothetical protein
MTKTKGNENDKILSTPSVTGSHATSESANLTIDSGHVGASNESFFLEFEPTDDETHREKTMNLKIDTNNKK